MSCQASFGSEYAVRCDNCYEVIFHNLLGDKGSVHTLELESNIMTQKRLCLHLVHC